LPNDTISGEAKITNTLPKVDASFADESQPFKHALLDDTQSQPFTSGMMLMNQSKTGVYQSGAANGKNACNGATMGSLF
jgi:hypothetical protein